MEPRPALRGGGDAVSSSPSMGWLLLLGPGSCVHPLPPELLGGSCCSRPSQEGLTELMGAVLRQCHALSAGAMQGWHSWLSSGELVVVIQARPMRW